MKDETIRVGDLVMVVRGKTCGCPSKWDGVVFTVSALHPISHCDYCLKTITDEYAAQVNDNWSAVAVSRLLKINPPAVDETVETSDEVTV